MPDPLADYMAAMAPVSPTPAIRAALADYTAALGWPRFYASALALAADPKFFAGWWQGHFSVCRRQMLMGTPSLQVHVPPQGPDGFMLAARLRGAGASLIVSAEDGYPLTDATPTLYPEYIYDPAPLAAMAGAAYATVRHTATRAARDGVTVTAYDVADLPPTLVPGLYDARAWWIEEVAGGYRPSDPLAAALRHGAGRVYVAAGPDGYPVGAYLADIAGPVAVHVMGYAVRPPYGVSDLLAVTMAADLTARGVTAYGSGAGHRRQSMAAYKERLRPVALKRLYRLPPLIPLTRERWAAARPTGLTVGSGSATLWAPDGA